MRIAHITATFPPYGGGTGSVCYYNARELVRRSHDVHVYTAEIPGIPKEEIIEGIQVHRLKPVLRFGNAPLLPGIIGLKGFDIIHLHNPFIFGSELVWLSTRLRKTPYVITHHNDLIGNDFRRSLFIIYRFFTSKIIFRGASSIFIVTKDHSLTSVHSKIFKTMENKIVEIPNGVDITSFTGNISADKKEFGLPDSGRVILFVGAIDRAHYYRRVDILLKAFGMIENPDAYLLIVGDGNLHDHYQKMAEQLGVGQRTIFLGNIPHDRLSEIYTMAEMVVLPSSIQESFGLVLIESMACGTPVIASNLPGVRTVVDDGGDGYLVEPENVGDLSQKMEAILSLSDEQRIAMGAAGRRKVKRKFTWELAGQRLESIYRQVIATGDQQAVSGGTDAE